MPGKTVFLIETAPCSLNNISHECYMTQIWTVNWYTKCSPNDLSEEFRWHDEKPVLYSRMTVTKTVIADGLSTRYTHATAIIIE